MNQWNVKSVDKASGTVKLLLSNVHMDLLPIDELSQILLELRSIVLDVGVLHVRIQGICLLHHIFMWNIKNWSIMDFQGIQLAVIILVHGWCILDDDVLSAHLSIQYWFLRISKSSNSRVYWTIRLVYVYLIGFIWCKRSFAVFIN